MAACETQLAGRRTIRRQLIRRDRLGVDPLILEQFSDSSTTLYLDLLDIELMDQLLLNPSCLRSVAKNSRQGTACIPPSSSRLNWKGPITKPAALS